MMHSVKSWREANSRQPMPTKMTPRASALSRCVPGVVLCKKSAYIVKPPVPSNVCALAEISKYYHRREQVEDLWRLKTKLYQGCYLPL
ncbi:hypothetical protein OH492_11855 [Vibrio chagasii]|nr:hypothetical protein [Vibrio chagasii]